MADWKSALREVKKNLASTKETEDKHMPGRHTDAKVVVGVKPTWRDARKVTIKARSAELQHAKSALKARPQPVASQRPNFAALAVASLSPKPEPAQVKASLPRPNGVPKTFHATHRRALTRQMYYKAPDPWVTAGAQTQLSPSLGILPVDIVIGLDFGTSYTKAAVGLKDKIFPVSWEGVSATPERYLLPSEYSVLDDGICQIGQAPTVPVEQVHQRLKHPFIDHAVSSASIAKAVVFVALVLRYVRAWVFRQHGSKIGLSKIRWLLNIGAPSNGLENGRLEIAYRKLGSMAWVLSLSETGIPLRKAQEMTSAWSPGSLPDDLTDLQVLPEFVAQIAGYVHSAQRRRGLHALVDVGGGTLDVVTFIVHERDDEDVFPFLVPEVRALGTQMLYQNRLVDAPGCDEACLPDELQPVLSEMEYAAASGLPEEHVRKRDQVLWGAVRDVVNGVFHKTKQKRYRLSDAWRDGLPTFLTGGGGKVEGYGNSVKTGGERHATALKLMPLPPHPRLVDFEGGIDDYQRISVACGLALDAFSLGQIIPAREVDDDVAPREQTIERPDRDELYPH